MGQVRVHETGVERVPVTFAEGEDDDFDDVTAKSVSAGSFSKLKKWSFAVMSSKKVQFLSSTRGWRCREKILG